MTLQIRLAPLLLTFFLGIPSAYSQHLDTLLDELVGSEADQMESEMTDLQEKKPPLPLSSAEMTSLPEEDEFAPEKNIVTKGVTLQGLDKQTGRVFIIEAAVGQPIEFGTLKIVVHHCEKTPLADRQESMAFVKITDDKPNSASQKLFSGWMFASSPSLSALDHPVYDVWIKDCKALDQ